MAVTVKDNRTILYQDGLTSITGASADETSFFAEATGCAAEAYNIATGQIYWSGTTPNFTTDGNELIYVWSAVVATQNGYKEGTVANSSHAMYLSDGADNLLIYQAGNDRDVFKHADGQVSFQCFLMDIDYIGEASKNGDLAVTAGTLGGFDSASTTMDVGAHYTTLSKALGGGNNCYMDIIRYGGADEGITIGGGTTGDRGTFAEAAVEDRSTSDNKAHGIIREYTGGAYGVQGTVHVGDSAGTSGDTWFEDDGISLTFEDRLVDSDKYKFIVEGGSGDNNFILTNSTIASARPAVQFEFDKGNVNDLTITGCVFLATKGNMTWSGNADASGHTSENNTFTGVASNTNKSFTLNDVNQTGCTFNDCGQISANGQGDLINCTINRTTHGTSMVLLNPDSAAVSNCTFTGEVTDKHAIELTKIPSTLTWNNTYDNFFDSGSAGTDIAGGSVGDEVLYFNPPTSNSDSCTINVSSGFIAPSIRKGTNYTGRVDIISTITVTLTDMDSATEVRVYEDGTTTVYDAGIENVGPTGQYAFSASPADVIDIRIFNITEDPADIIGFTVPSNNTSLPVSQNFDRNYTNP
jgi:hypothetical protein